MPTAAETRYPPAGWRTECSGYKPLRRWKTISYSDAEVLQRIYGEGGEFPLPTWYLCDRCAGLYESLDSLGFCGMLGENLEHACREYAQMQRYYFVFRLLLVLGKCFFSGVDVCF